MVKASYNQQAYEIVGNDSVLDTLLNNNVDVPYGCRSGICQACMMQCTEGEPTQISQLGLSPYQKEQRFFLSCCCRPSQDISLRLPPKAIRYQSEISYIERLNNQVLLVRLKSPIPFQPGQTIQIAIDGLQRRYSIASLPPHQNYIELHIECRPTGAFSHAISKMSVGDSLSISSAYGNFTYRDVIDEQPLLMVGVLTGLAPLYGIAKKAVQQGHSGNIDVVHICPAPSQYYQSEMRSLSLQYPNIQFHQLEQSEDYVGELADYLKVHWPVLQQHKFYLAGKDELIQPLEKVAFLQGVSRSNMLIESFKTTR